MRHKSYANNLVNNQSRRHMKMATASENNWKTSEWQRQTKVTMKMILILYFAIGFGECQQQQPYGGLPSISQISPKSSSHQNHIYFSHSLPLILESTIGSDLIAQPSAEQDVLNHEDNETHHLNRFERSAQPILNQNFPKTGPNEVLSSNDADFSKEAGAGRYFQYNIKPTETHNAKTDTQELTQRPRSGKTLNPVIPSSLALGVSTSTSFLLKGDLRPPTSGSPIIPTSSFASSTVASAMTTTPNKARQNQNPDIQDIITGIVKLLNGNVNVHANTQGMRRPTASRINNRGPPRISDVPALPMDYDAKKPPLGTSIRPPPYPFDRPDRPFITGIPIPEQVVPYRPGFVSNRPPWHRHKPRPPITTTIGNNGGGRRPIHQYKPVSGSEPQNLQPEHQMQPMTMLTSHQVPPPLINVPLSVGFNEKESGNTSSITDNNYDSEFSSEDENAQYIEVSDSDSETAASDTNMDELDEKLQLPESLLNKYETPNAKKKPTKPKSSSEKKRPPTNVYTTIVETSSEIHTITNMASTYMPIPMSINIDNGADVEPSTEEVIFMTPSRTPALETSIYEFKKSSSSISSSPIIQNDAIETSGSEESHGSIQKTDIQDTINPTKSYYTPSIPSTSTTIVNNNDNIIQPNSATPTDSISIPSNPPSTSTSPQEYQPRPGIVLDDPEFKPGGSRPRPNTIQRSPQQQQTAQIQSTRHHLPPGYGEIFDVTLSAIQGPGNLGGSQQTINIKPYGSYNSGSNGQQGDIIVSASGDDGFVSIDGKRTYINLFGDPIDPPAGAQLSTTPTTVVPQIPGAAANQNTIPSVGAGYGVSETEVVELRPTMHENQTPIPQGPPVLQHTTNSVPTRPLYRQRPTHPPVRIDTCIVGDDSTCDQAQHEHCKTESGVSSCHCRPGYSRRKHREPCRKVISFHLGMRVDRIYEHRIVWDNKLLDGNSEPYGQLSYESIRAIDSAMSMTPYSDEFMEAKVNNIYRGDLDLGGNGVFVNLTIRLDESVETLRPNLRSDVQKHILGVLHRRNNNIGNSVLYVTSPEGAVSALHDLDECHSGDLNDCHTSATCVNTWGSFRCACQPGFRDPWANQPQRAGRECQSCPDAYCNNHGTCSFTDEGIQSCSCDSSHYGSQCEIDGDVLGVAIGASVAAVIIIILTLVCLIMWSRRWQREQKNAIGSPVFGYMNTAPLKSAGLPQTGYQVTLEDRMRWAQIADVMAQTNHYGAEPIGPTRPSSALFAAYPNLQATTLGMGTIGGMSMQNTLQMHQGGNLAPPVPLPRRLGLSSRSNGMRTLENSSSSEEEDRTDLLGRSFQVPRPKSRSNGSIANQSGIYYDVDYEPSGNGIGNTSVDHLYSSQNQSSSHSHVHSHTHSHSHSQGIPMSTYTSGRAPNSYYMK